MLLTFEPAALLLCVEMHALQFHAHGVNVYC